MASADRDADNSPPEDSGSERAPSASGGARRSDTSSARYPLGSLGFNFADLGLKGLAADNIVSDRLGRHLVQQPLFALPKPVVWPGLTVPSIPNLAVTWSTKLGGVNFGRVVGQHWLEQLGAMGRAHSAFAAQQLVQHQQSQIQEIVAKFGRLRFRIYPANWEDVEAPFLEDVLRIATDEGVPLAWVPAASTLRKLLQAPDAEQRLSVLVECRHAVIGDCNAALEGIDDERLDEYRVFALEVAAMLAAGFDRGAQALAANLLDSIVRSDSLLPEGERRAARPSRKEGSSRSFEGDDLFVPSAMVMGPVWSSLSHYVLGSGDPIPVRFNRHASAHHVGDQQYTSVNALIALMVVTSLLRLVHDEYPQRKAA